MSDILRIHSSDDGGTLELRATARDRIVAMLVRPGLSASVDVYADISSGLGALFAELATHWRGWEGERSWSSLEDEVTLTATCDRSGHVFLRVDLRERFAPHGWRVESVLSLEAGQLDALAREAAAFERVATGAA